MRSLLWPAAVPAGLLATMLAGCGTLETFTPFEARRIDYRSAQPGAALEVPPDLAPPRYDERYRVGGVATLSGITAASRAAAMAGAGGVLPTVPGVRIERAGTERWLVVNAPPEVVFGRLREFWSSLNLSLVVDDPRIGIMETDWAENRARIHDDPIRRTIGRLFDNVYSSGTRDKYRVRIERAPNNTTEVYVSHRGLEEKNIGTGTQPVFRWEPRRPEPEFEAEILQRMLVFLGTPRETAQELARSATSPGAPRPEQATIAGSGADQRLVLADPFDRAWRRVGLALDRVGFTVVDRDRTAGTYFVRYADPELIARNEPGLLERLRFWAGSGERAVAEQYRIVLTENAGQSVLVVRNAQGVADGSPIADRIIRLLYEQLR
ncbi:MAG: outer membrane protein assembly factor BamC [Casimicrobiaceae bacterium]|nr:outer membrane protein assembly factor BamC [Casimicrobiaceae bacterium]